MQNRILTTVFPGQPRCCVWHQDLGRYLLPIVLPTQQAGPSKNLLFNPCSSTRIISGSTPWILHTAWWRFSPWSVHILPLPVASSPMRVQDLMCANTSAWRPWGVDQMLAIYLFSLFGECFKKRACGRKQKCWKLDGGEPLCRNEHA